MALVRWQDADSEILSESGLRNLVEAYWAAGLEVLTELKNGLRQFELYPSTQREHPAESK
jgi:hypothetical protein